MKDYIIRATAADNSIRIFAATTTEMVETARIAHSTADVVTAALGRLLTAGAMMGSMMKNTSDVLTLQINSEGRIKGLVVTASLVEDDGRECVDVKGYAKNPYVELPLNEKGKLDVAGAVGQGFLSVTKDLGMKEPFTGQTELVSGEIAEDLTYYFANSEQVPSATALGVLLNGDDSVRCAGGFIIQLLPFADEDIISSLEARLAELPPVTKLLSEGMTPEDILKKLFDGWDLTVTDRIPAFFRCNCSRERVKKSIQSVEKAEIEAMVAEDKPIEVNCHFCNKNYTFTVDDLIDILGKKNS